MTVSYDKLWVILNEKKYDENDLFVQQRSVPMQGKAWTKWGCTCGRSG